MSEKITLFVTIWIIVALLITGDSELELFFILIFIGFVITSELVDRFTTTHLKNRIRIFIFVFLIIFAMIIGKRIISFLSI